MAEFVTANIGTCWWCGAPADSREHKLKRTDIERGFGRGPYRDGRTLVKQQYGQRGSDVTGAKSKAFKFRPTICKRCNGVRSQPFDLAYDQFMHYLVEHERQVLATATVDLRDVFGDAWLTASADLGRYFVKHIGCRLAEVSDRRVIWLDRRLHEYLDGGSYPTCLQMEFLLDVSVAEMLRALALFPDEDGAPAPQGTFLHLTGIGGAKDDRFEPLEAPEAGMVVGWFGSYWRIAEDRPIPNPLAGPIVSLLVTDWTFGTELRERFSAIADGVDAGKFDPEDQTFAQIMATLGFDQPVYTSEPRSAGTRPSAATPVRRP